MAWFQLLPSLLGHKIRMVSLINYFESFTRMEGFMKAQGTRTMGGAYSILVHRIPSKLDGGRAAEDHKAIFISLTVTGALGSKASKQATTHRASPLRQIATCTHTWTFGQCLNSLEYY